MFTEFCDGDLGGVAPTWEWATSCMICRPIPEIFNQRSLRDLAINILVTLDKMRKVFCYDFIPRESCGC